MKLKLHGCECKNPSKIIGGVFINGGDAGI
jgi:hypothetical protein